MKLKEYTIKPYRLDYGHDWLIFDILFNDLHDPNGTGNSGYREHCYGRHVLIVCNGGLQAVEHRSVSQDTKVIFKSICWQNIYKLLPEMPITTSSKFTGQIEFHTNEGHLQQIKFIPKT